MKKDGFYLLVIFFALVNLQAMGLQLDYLSPAKQWNEGLPIGNGYMGAVILGQPSCMRIQFNEESLVNGDTIKVGCYQPFGNVLLKTDHDKYSNYYRYLSLDSAYHAISYRSDGVDYKITSFASYLDHVIVTHVTASKKHAISMTVVLDDEHGAVTTCSGKKLMFSGTLPENGMRYESQLYLKAKGGTVRAQSHSISVSHVTELTLYLSAATDFVMDRSRHFKSSDSMEKLTSVITSVSKQSYSHVLKTHLNDYQPLFSRVRLTLGEKPTAATSQLLADYDENKGNPYMEALLFQYGRYLMIASSRPGTLPTNLQGVWNDQKTPAWYSQYTTDINIEMNYWLTESTGIPECAEPYFRWVEMLSEMMKERAKKDKNIATLNGKGWINYSTANTMGGVSTWGVNHPGSAWMSQHFWERYAFGCDISFLRDQAYPLLKELTECWEAELVLAPDRIHLITSRGWSPEHGPGMVEGDRTLRQGVAYDMEIVYDLFTNYLEAANVLGQDREYAEHISQLRNRLLPLQVGRWGQLQEWMEDVDDPNDHHRHFSHLFAVHPGREISPLIDKRLSDAAIISLVARGNKNTGWSTAWRICVFSRLLQTGQAYQYVREMLKNNLFPNLFDQYMMGKYAPFQIDGNYGYTAGIAEMLLQSHIKKEGRYVYQLLPALPAEWRQGEINGLRARGGCVVNQSWAEGQLTRAIIIATQKTDFLVSYQDKMVSVSLNKGEHFTFVP